MMTVWPVLIQSPRARLVIYAAPAARIHIFNARLRVLQPGQAEQSGAPPVIAAGHLALHQQAQTLFKAQAAHGRLAQLLLQRIAHAAEFEAAQLGQGVLGHHAVVFVVCLRDQYPGDLVDGFHW